MSINSKLSHLVEHQFPDFVQEDGPTLIAFVKAYYEWMEQTGKHQEVLANLLDYRDVDATLDAYIAYFQDEVLSGIPENILADKRKLIKSIPTFYRAKGSEKSFQLLFRILYDSDIEFYYPGSDILRASDGKWTQDTLLKCEGEDDIFDMNGLEITGAVSEATAVIETILKKLESGRFVYEMHVSKVLGTFVNGELLTDSNGFTARIITSGGVTEESGRYIGTDGFVSWNKFLHDGVFYQEFSYQLKTSEFINKYRDIVRRLIHPAGTGLFGGTQFEDTKSLESAVAMTFTITPHEDTTEIGVTALSDFTTFTPEVQGIFSILPTQMYGTLQDYTWSQMTGVVNVSSNNQIAALAADPLDMWDEIAVGAIGDGEAIIGTGTLFETEIFPANNNFIMLVDPLDVIVDQAFEVDGVASNTVMDINQSYTGTLANGQIWVRSADIAAANSITYGLVSDSVTATHGYGLITDTGPILLYYDYTYIV
jgi:hypothetical protein